MRVSLKPPKELLKSTTHLRGKRKMKEGLTKSFTLLKEQFTFVTCLAELFWKPEEGRILTTFLGNSAYSKNDP